MKVYILSQGGSEKVLIKEIMNFFPFINDPPNNIIYNTRNSGRYTPLFQDPADGCARGFATNNLCLSPTTVCFSTNYSVFVPQLQCVCLPQ